MELVTKHSTLGKTLSSYNQEMNVCPLILSSRKVFSELVSTVLDLYCELHVHAEVSA